ncbi:MAG TPA: hypothetical protein DDX14_07905, partial [Cyanobacteria bacterium UBA9579]|nr:hypothetical protein [Cyanobacteria bacterium UBA9579]
MEIKNTIVFKLITVLSKVQIIIFVIFIFSITPVFAKSDSNSPHIVHSPQQKSETENIKANSGAIIVNLDINNKLNYDYEVFANTDGTFSLPFKSTAKLLDISVSQNKLTKEISFTLPDGKFGTVDFQKQKIILGDKIIELGKYNKMVFLKEGILEETKDEVFVPIKILNDILNINILQDMSDYSISIKTDKPFNALIVRDKQNNAGISFKNFPEPDNTLLKLFTPKEKGIISFDTIKFDSQSQFLSSKQTDLFKTSKDFSFYNTAQIALNGALLGGEYEIKNNPHIIGNNILSPGGVGFGYKKGFKKYNLELGSISGMETGSFDIGQGILGININNEKNTGRKLQDGIVAPGSKVNVYVNDKLVSTINTQGGYYDLKDLSSVNNKAGKLKLEEITLEGKVSKIKEEFYQPDPNLLIKGQKQFDLISGITGYNDYLFDNYNSMNNYYAKKLTGGIKLGYGLTDKLTVNFAGISDYIVSLPNKQDFLSRIPLNKGITSLIFSGYRDFNPTHGETSLLSFYYAPRDNLALTADFGISHASSTIDDEFYKINPLGFSSVLSIKYNKPLYALSGSLFNYSSSFYMAGSSGIGNNASYLNDKLGVDLSSYINFKKIYLNGRVNGYFSNLYSVPVCQ